MALLDVVKEVAQQAQDASVPAAFLTGLVTSAAPLTVRVDNRFELSGAALVVMREFGAGAYATHTHTLNGQTTEAEVYTGLAAGDKVVLLRNQGGQEFLVLGRV